MIKILLYLLQSILASGILYGYYHFFLRNKKFHQYNRFYLLAAVVISIIVPFLNIPVYFSANDSDSAIVFQTLQDISIKSGRETPYSETNQFFGMDTLMKLLGIVYSCIVFICVCRIFNSLYKIKRIINKNDVEELDGIRFINTNEPGTPFSFFRWLFWNNKIPLKSDNGQQIFRHELYHIEQKHSIDVLFIEIVLILGWFNPFFHLVRKELRAIHEFLADRFAVRETENWEYAELLLKQALDTQTSLVNPFFHNQIKRRIAMITSSNKTTHQYLRKLMVLPVATLAIALFAFTYRNKETNELVQGQPLNLELMTASDTVPGKQTTLSLVAKDDSSVRTKPENSAVEKVVIGKKSENGVATITLSDPKKFNDVLIVLDGKVQPLGYGDEKLNRLDPSKIESINVLKDKNGVAKYGPNASNGVIEITTKTGNSELKEVTLSEASKDEVIVQGYGTKKRSEGEVKEVVINDTKRSTKDEVTVQGYSSKRTPTDGEVKEIRITDEKHNPVEEVVVTGYPSGNKIFTKTEFEAEFPGGINGWREYLMKNLNANVPVDNGAPGGVYTVLAQFVVNEDGTLSDIKTLTKHGYGMEEEVLKLLQKGPNWTPAKQNGKSVKAYRKQPITFMVTEEKAEADDKIYPNPTTQTAVLKIVTEEAGESYVTISDINGKLKSTSKKTFQKGSNTITLITRDLENGLYTITVNMPGKAKQVRFYKLLKQ